MFDLGIVQTAWFRFLMYLIQHYVIKYVSDLLQVGGFLRVIRLPPPIQIYCYDITEILLKVALSTINQIKPTVWYFLCFILLLSDSLATLQLEDLIL